MLLTLMSACFSCMFVRNLLRRDLAVRYLMGSVRCAAHTHVGMFEWHVCWKPAYT